MGKNKRHGVESRDRVIGDARKADFDSEYTFCLYRPSSHPQRSSEAIKDGLDAQVVLLLRRDPTSSTRKLSRH